MKKVNGRSNTFIVFFNFLIPTLFGKSIFMKETWRSFIPLRESKIWLCSNKYFCTSWWAVWRSHKSKFSKLCQLTWTWRITFMTITVTLNTTNVHILKVHRAPRYFKQAYFIQVFKPIVLSCLFFDVLTYIDSNLERHWTLFRSGCDKEVSSFQRD